MNPRLLFVTASIMHAACGGPSDDPDGESDAPLTYEFDDIESYYDAFANKLCTYWESCGDGGPCPYLDEDWTETTTTSFTSCSFDEDRAEECLATEFECDVSGNASSHICVPRICTSVYDCGSSTVADDFGCL